MDNLLKSGCFIDYDGHGRYANGKMMSPITIIPSDVGRNQVLQGWSHIVWFNR